MDPDGLKDSLWSRVMTGVVVHRFLESLPARLRRLRKRRATAGLLAEEVLSLPPEAIGAVVRRSHGRLHSRPLVEELIRRCEAHVLSGPATAERAGEAALAVLDGLPLERLERTALQDLAGRRGWNDLRGHALANLGNLRRIACDWEASEERFAAAYRCLAEGSGDIALAGRLYSLHASFLRDRRQFSAAGRCLRQAEEIYQALGEDHQLGRVLLKSAELLALKEEYPDAVQTQMRALRLLDSSTELATTLGAWANLAEMMLRIGSPLEADRVLLDSETLTRKVGEQSIAHITWRWIRGRVALVLHDDEGAEADLVWAEGSFMAAGDPFNRGLVGLDRMKLYLRQRRFEELAEVAEPTLSALLSQDLAPEALQAVRLVAQAFERRDLELHLIERVSEELRRGGRRGTACRRQAQ